MSEWNAETAEWYAKKYGEYPTNRLAVDALDLPADAVVVDVGCGTGSALRHINRGTLIGVDPVERMVEIARERSVDFDIEFRVGSAEAIPVDDAFADVVLAFDSLDHWTDPSVGLAEVRRVLKPGGYLALVKDNDVPPTHDHVQALADAGFTVTSERVLEEGDVACTLWVAR